MGNLTPKPHMQNRAILILLMPVVAILWLIGWSLHWIGDRNQQSESRKKNQNEDDVTFNLLIPEQQYAK